MNEHVKRRSVPRIISENFVILILMVAVYLLMWAMDGHDFVAMNNLSSMAYQLPILGLLSLGMMIAMLSGGINLSIIATANFNGIMIAVLIKSMAGGSMLDASGAVVLLCIIGAFICSMLVGVINGLFISLLKIPDILVTLGTMSIVGGVNVWLTEGYTISDFPQSVLALGNSTILGIPSALIIFVIGAAVASFILNRTSFGHELYMMGSNQQATRYSNVSLVKVTVQQYMLSSFFAVLCSLVMIGQLNSVKADYASSYLLVSILAGFLGNVNPFGGFGKVAGTVIAVIILQFISSGLNLMGVDSFLITAMWGLIIIVVVIVKGAVPKIKKARLERKNSN
ncbi:MAG: ABC transporter permease [Succinivibrio sp.]|jgi:simple sugar transport system permease protein|nr:ABC transporter permease [Succinivibrio sp.]